MKSRTLLEKLGFSQEESLIYKALLKMGPSSISTVVRETGLHRPAVYRFLPILLERGLISSVPKGKHKLFSAESPKKIVDIIESLKQEVADEVTDMQNIYEAQGKKPLITYAEGPRAITAVYSDIVHSLKRGDIYFRYSSNKILNRELYVPQDYREVRDRKGLERLVITNVPSKKLHRPKLGRIVKAIPQEYDLFEDNITQVIYDDKVAIVDYNTGSAITIKNKIFADFQKKIFKLLFSKL